jgi:membrane-associated protease RseP (regulator of RpoE activity)
LRFIGHLFAIVLAVIVATIAAGVVVAMGIWGPQWHSLSGDIGERIYFWGTVAIAASFTGAMGLLPMAVLIALAESLKIRSLIVHLAAGAVLLLTGYYSSGAITASYEESIDRPPPPVSRAAEVAAAAGVAFGFAYWLIAGRNAGRWRERRVLPPSLPPQAAP